MTTPTSPSSPTLSGKVLTFHLGDELFGITIIGVREIVSMQPMTALPNTPHYVRGVIDLRGRFVPVVDLRERLGLMAGEESEATCIIVLRVHDTQLGVVVDAVEDVADVVAEEIEPPPPNWTGGAADYLLGMTRAGESALVLIDMDKIFPATEMATLAAGDFPL